MRPVIAQVLAQETGDDHAHAVVHPARVPELAHAGIDDGHAGASLLPGRQLRRVHRRPAEILETGIEVAFRRVREMVEQMMRELAPTQFAQVVRDIWIGLRRPAFRAQARDDLPGRDLAEMQMRREQGGAGAIREVALLLVAVRGAVHEDIQRLRGPGFAGPPLVPEAAIPARLVGRRRQAKIGEIGRRERRRQRRQSCRRLLERDIADALREILPEGRKDAIRLACSGRDRPGFGQQGGVETLDLQAAPFQRVLDPRVARDAGRFVQAVPVHRFGLRLFDQLLQLVQAVADAQDQAHAAAAQVRIQRQQRAMQPGRGRGARLPGPFLVRRMDIHRNDRAPRFQRGDQGGVVGQAQVAAKPDDDGGHEDFQRDNDQFATRPVHLA